MSAFFDTNILVYAVSATDPRREIAAAVLAQGGTVSVQVLNEFANVAYRKLGWDWGEIDRAIALFQRHLGRVRPLTVATHDAARALAAAHTLSFYDALIVASALEAECSTLFSQDMQAGRRFGDLMITDPF